MVRETEPLLWWKAKPWSRVRAAMKKAVGMSLKPHESARSDPINGPMKGRFSEHYYPRRRPAYAWRRVLPAEWLAVRRGSRNRAG